MAGKRCGYIAIVGRPNVGKSTLLNHLLGQKISITSRKPQTTRHQVLGIKTEDDHQFIFVDTPGLHFDQRKNLNRQINRTATASLSGVDMVIFMIDYRGWSQSVIKMLRLVTESGPPVILIINKIDRLKEKSKLLPLIAESSALHSFLEIVPLSAKHDDLDTDFLPTIVSHLPPGPPGFPADQLTDRGPAFQASEVVREQTFALLGEELPYDSAVEVTQFDRSDPDFWVIGMIIWVEREGQKRIIIGKGGSVLKKLGSQARQAMEHHFGVRIRLDLWVKERQGWADNLAMLRSLGYTDE
mgnify:CR=1 FL=1